MIAAVFVSRPGQAQLAPAGTHSAGRASDTGFAGPNERGGYVATVPLDLPASRGGLPIPFQIVSGTRGFGAAGRGWDVPLSSVYVDHSFAHRRPGWTPTGGLDKRERITVSLPGRALDMLRYGDHWIARDDASVTMKAVDGTWQVIDGNGITYKFVKDPLLYATGGGGINEAAGLWLLDSIEDRGGAKVQLDYAISTVTTPEVGDSLITIDLVDLKYNPDSSAACFKHQIDLSYDADEAGPAPQALSVLGERAIARFHKLHQVVVRSRETCAVAPAQLRAYDLTYQVDPDTQQAQLSAIRMRGRADGAATGLSIPVAGYHYGTASTTDSHGKPILEYAHAGASTTVALPAGASTVLASDKKTTLFAPPVSGSPYATTQGLLDFNGDGRPDLLYSQDNKIQIATGTSDHQFNPGVPLTDPTFTRKVLDARSSSADRFANEGTPDAVVQDYTWTQSIDMNGDGRIDVVDAAEKQNTWVVYLNTPDTGPGAAPSGIKWVRQEVDMTGLRHQIAANGLIVPDNYLPLAGRRTTRDLDVKFTWLSGDDRVWILSQRQITGVEKEQTYTEYKIVDMNGDGYPDVVFDESPLGYSEIVPPNPLFSNYNLPTTTSQAMTLGLPHGNRLRVAYNIAGVHTQAYGSGLFADPVYFADPSSCAVEQWSGNDGSGMDGQNDRLQLAGCGLLDVNGDGLVDRTSGATAMLGTGSNFGVARLSVDKLSHTGTFAAQRSEYAELCGKPDQPDDFIAAQLVQLKDLTGDGIPDLVSFNSWLATAPGNPIFHDSYAVFVGTGAGFAKTAIHIDGPVSVENERCDGTASWTVRGFYDLDGDGVPEIVYLAGSNQLGASHLQGGDGPGSPDAGRLTRIDNGYGASISLSYTSAKNDGRTAHNVPYPEIVVASVRTDGVFGLGGDLAATSYAYGDIGMFYDSVQDGFRSSGYQRRVAIATTSTPANGSPSVTATISDAYPLDPVTPATFALLREEQKWGRYLAAGRPRDTTTLVGPLGTDPWALLSIDVTTDPRRIAATHYIVDTLDTHWYADATSPAADDCIDMAYPYDFQRSKFSSTYNPCSARGFLYTRSTQSWRGSEAPPSAKNVQTATSVRSVDDLTG